MWTSRTPHQAVPQACSGSGKRPWARVGGSTRARENDIPTPPPFPAGAVIAVGWTQVGDFCHVPVMIAGVSCTALLDTGSNATLVRPDVVPTGAAVQPTNVQLKTVTGDLAPIRGRGVFQFKVGDLGVPYAAWVADVQDACILGLDFLRAIGGVLDLGKSFLILPDGQKLQLIPPPVCSASAAVSTSTSETPADLPAEQQAEEEERLSAGATTGLQTIKNVLISKGLPQDMIIRLMSSKPQIGAIAAPSTGTTCTPTDNFWNIFISSAE